MSDDVAENDPAWVEACRREEAIRDLLRRYPDRLTVRAVEDLAYWVEKLLGAAAPLHRAGILRCVAALAMSDLRGGPRRNAGA